MAAIACSPQERRSLYLKLAAEAETKAAKPGDPEVKTAWIDSAVSWMMMASEISENKVREPCSAAYPIGRRHAHPVS